jgi:hypothetical protein
MTPSLVAGHRRESDSLSNVKIVIMLSFGSVETAWSNIIWQANGKK